ncbi:MAG: hypothetical protein NTZ80_03975 [Patescibacteria group bacterium]|nr:hypothetical protein [Patescibacteria group bacterium]
MPTCPKCQSQFEITQDDLLFYDKISPVFNGRKYQIPEPKLCPDCKEQRRLALRNESKFYKRECGICGKIIISVYSPKSDYTVYCHECWWSDNFDPVEYGCDFDFSKSFSEQFQELFKNVPAVNLNTHSSNENSDYVNYISKSKNCYMCVAGGFLEDVYYSNLGINCKQSMDIYFSFDSELCYEIMNCSNCYDVKYSKDSKGCNNSWFVDDCIGCSNCILCSGLKNKSYCFKNKQLSKEEFFTIEKDFISNLPTEINHYREEFKWICLSVPKKYIHILNSESCSGDYIANSKGCVNCFEIRDAEDCINCMNVMGVKDVRSCSQCGLNTEVAYELMTGSLNIYHILFSSVIRDNSSDILYSFNISSCSNCFACIGLRRKQYCILNKQYSKQEYEELVPRIIEHMQKSTPLSPPYSRGEASEASRGVEWPEWGEFFNPRLSNFCYNETVAVEYFPLTNKEAH